VGQTKAVDRRLSQVYRAADDNYRQALSLISHELRSPAAVVSGYLRLLMKDDSAPLSERQRQILEEASSSCANLWRLIHDISELGAVANDDTSFARSLVPIFALCEEVISGTTTEDMAARTFTCSDKDRAAVVLGDAARLRRACSALVSACERERGQAALEGYGFVHDTGPFAQVVVAFDGPGVSSRLDAVLSSRKTFDRWRGGTGLTVPIACRIIEEHHGQIWSFSSKIRGAFAWSLPLATGSDLVGR